MSMSLLIESTDLIVDVDGVKCRVWEGTTEEGTPVRVLVHRVAVALKEDTLRLEQELQECTPPLRIVPLSDVMKPV